MMKRAFLLFGTCLAAAATAEAQPVSGPYVSLGGGGNVVQDETLRLNENFPGGKYRYGVGIAGVGAIGYGFGNGFRVEAEGDFRQSPVQHFLGTRFPTASGGEQRDYGGMLNALFDMDIRQNWIYPYFGAGVGYAETEWRGVNTYSPDPVYAFRAGGTYGSFAYQGIFGLAFPMPFLPGLSVTAEYRFYSALAPIGFHGVSEGELGPSGGRPFAIARGNADVTTNYNHTALLGLRYALFQPAPPPPPAPPAPVAAPAPAPTRTYLVFFDWDRADLTPRARAIIGEAAQASTRVQTTRIEVNGYTDLSGTAAYNQRLSVRRARSVEAELVRDGVPQSAISIHGYGEQNPLVPTAQGVREPQNRRVEIILR